MTSSPHWAAAYDIKAPKRRRFYIWALPFPAHMNSGTLFQNRIRIHLLSKRSIRMATRSAAHTTVRQIFHKFNSTIRSNTPVKDNGIRNTHRHIQICFRFSHLFIPRFTVRSSEGHFLEGRFLDHTAGLFGGRLADLFCETGMTGQKKGTPRSALFLSRLFSVWIAIVNGRPLPAKVGAGGFSTLIRDNIPPTHKILNNIIKWRPQTSRINWVAVYHNSIKWGFHDNSESLYKIIIYLFKINKY